jgi:hypothetical protein
MDLKMHRLSLKSIMGRALVAFLTILLFSCAKDNEVVAVAEEPTDVLSDAETIFLEEYHYVTFNLSPTSFGADLNEKWEQELKLFLDGDFPAGYSDAVDAALQSFNAEFTDGFTISLTANQTEANAHLIFGPTSTIESVWPDMYQAVSEGGFAGYALYNGNDFAINSGRIWVENNSIPLFKHELGHIIGLGHASDVYCGEAVNQNDSFMCSFLALDLSPFDKGILKLLYHPDINKGQSFEALKPELEALILDGVVSF